MVSFVLDVARGTAPVPPPFLQPLPVLDLGPIEAKVMAGLKIGVSVGCTLAKGGVGVAGLIAGGLPKVGCRLYSLANEAARLVRPDGSGLSAALCDAVSADPEFGPCEPFDGRCDAPSGIGCLAPQEPRASARKTSARHFIAFIQVFDGSAAPNCLRCPSGTDGPTVGQPVPG